MSNPSNISAFASVAALRALWPLPAGTSSAFVQGEVINGAQGMFDWVPGSSATDNSGVGGAGVGCIKPTANSGSGRWITSISTPQQLSFRFSTFAAAQAATIPSAITEVILGGYYAEGDCSPAKYKQVGSQPTHNGGKFQSANGLWFQYVPDARGANARAFGAVADGVDTSGTFTGTNSAPFIQNCVDFAAYFALCKAYIPAGVYLVNDAIQLGYGITGFETVNLEGDGKRKRSSATAFSGTGLLCNFSDRPGLSISGARNYLISGLSLFGKNYYWISGNNMLSPVPLVDDTVLDNWIDPTLNVNANSRYAPYCAIAIDPYAGVQPTPHYPDVTFPAWAGSPPQYGKNFSSAVQIENCYFGGFVSLIAIQPCNADGNGDFIKFTNCYVEAMAYIVTAGNTQGRQCTVMNCSFATYHTGVANTVIGLEAGQLELTSIGTDWENCIQVLDVEDNTDVGPALFLNSYSESIWRVGTWGSGGAGGAPLTFNSHAFQFSAQNDYRGYPPYIFQFSGPTPITYKNCSLHHYNGKLFFMNGPANGIEFFNNLTNTTPPTSIYEKIAHSFLGGSMMFVPTSVNTNFPLAFANMDVHGYDATGASLGEIVYGRYSLSNRNNPICAWLSQARPTSQLDYQVNVPAIWSVIGKSGLTISLSGTTLTVTFPSRSDQTYYYNGGLPGDVIYDDNSGSVFYIRSRTTTTILAELQNNYRIVGGTFDANGMSTGGGTVTPFNAFSTSAGNFYFGNSRFFLPEYFLRGDISTASAVISNAARDDGFATWMDGDSQIVINDYLYINAQLDRFFSPANTLIAGVSGASSTITLSGNGARTETIHPLGFFIRQPPANV